MKHTLSLLLIFSLFLVGCATPASPPPASEAPEPLAATTVPTTSAAAEAAVAAAAAPAATAAAPTPGQAEKPQWVQTATATITALSADASAAQPLGEDLTRVDDQGAVVVEVTPTNLSAPGESFEFEVALNTHSVNLSMDLAHLATLTTDTGLSVPAAAWDGMSGGHHVSGTLLFPAQVNGKNLLESASVLTLTIQKVDAAERTFTWDLHP